MIENLLEIRKNLKNKKPEFIRQDTHKRKKLAIKWRKPKGIHSKIRHHFKGRKKMPSPGYKSPLKVRGLHASGLKAVSVFSLEDIKKIKRESEGAVISKNIGMKKRLEILKKAKETNIMVLNLNAEEMIKKIEDFVGLKKKKIEETKKEVPKETKKTEEAKEKSELSEKEKKEQEKKEKDKVLIKRV